MLHVPSIPPSATRLEQRIQTSKPTKDPRSAWNYFQKHAGPAIVAARAELTTLADCAKAIAAEWRSLSEQEREK